MLQVKNVHKEYRVGDMVQKALNDVSLNLRDSEFVAILGPSGSGKTTLLNIIGGLDNYSAGDLIINGISTKKYKDRDWDSYRNHTVGFVFQSYNLIPHQTVLSNVELALTISGISKSERKKRALAALKEVGLEGHEYKRPNQMSGGQMQRVAIARALVNDPDILLADEPTGALDSDTSVQVMDLLEAVAKDRLVVMVTHNPELAEQYATRIVNLRDGEITSDSNPYTTTDDITTRHENMGKSSMSFLTSLALSFNNLRTKKARTFLTSFAGSIGIIGISLILSLSTGVNTYIKQIEEETLTQYPVLINSSGFDISSMMGDMSAAIEKEPENDGEIYVSQMLTTVLSKIGSNDLKSLKNFLEDDQNNIKAYANAIEYSYNVEPQIYATDTKKIHQVHPDTSFAKLGMGGAPMGMSIGPRTDTFYQLPANSNLYESQYNIRAGHWPQKYNETVLVLSSSGKITDVMLYALGLRDSDELDNMIDKFSREEEVSVPKNDQGYAYDDILKLQYKLVNPVDCYQYDDKYNVYVDKKDDKAYMENLIKNGEDIKIVGVVQPNEDATTTMLQQGVAYPADLLTHIIDKTRGSDIVKKQLAKPNINVFTGKDFNNKEENKLDMESLFSIDENKLRNAFAFDQSKLNMGDMDFSDINIDFGSLPPIDIAAIFKDINIDIEQEDIEQVIDTLTQGFSEYLVENGITTPTTDDFIAYLQTPKGQELLQTEFGGLLQQTDIVGQFQAGLQKQMETMMMQASSSIMSALEEKMTQQFQSFGENLQNAFSVDTEMFASAMQVNMDEKQLSELMMSFMTKDMSSYDGNLQKLGYANFDKPNNINIYPKDFESKQSVIDSLNAYNEKMEKVDSDKKIIYSDPVGILMSSVTDIINVITYVLIAFVAISLVVSSIMIGVITYISVLERKKEIGILRAIGASKNNISQVFNAETFIIGLFSGVLGIGVTLLLLIPGNMLIHFISGNSTINAILPVQGAIILVVLSVLLTLLGGLIPSRKAAQEDPVTALRSE